MSLPIWAGIHSRPQALLVLSLVLTFYLVASDASAQGPVFGPCAEESTAPAEVADALDTLLVAMVNPENDRAAIDGYAPGGVLSVAAPTWRYIRSIGTTAADVGDPIDCTMPYQVGSATKMMTAAVLLQLHEERALSVDDRLSEHLPDLAASLPNGSDITLRQLANHTSGVFSYTDNAPDGALGLMEGGISDAAMLRSRYAPAELIDFAVEHGRSSFVSGTQGAWSYSNSGYVIMGQIIERVAKKPLESVFEERIFGPLGMHDSFLWGDIPRAHFGLPRSFLAPPFDVETTEWNMSQGWAAGAVISTVNDMTVFIAALVEGRLFEDRQTLDIMRQTVPTPSPLMPAYGLGLGDKTAGFWGHAGQTLGFSSDTGYEPEHNIAVVTWTNSAYNPSQRGVFDVSTKLRITGILPE